MDTDVLFTIALLVLAVLLIGSVLLIRRGRAERLESSIATGSVKFRDCYDLCAGDPEKEVSRSCSTMCTQHGGV